MKDATSEPNGNFYNGWPERPRHSLMRMVKYDAKDGFDARPSNSCIGIAVLVHGSLIDPSSHEPNNV
jgi:hypothetical protein